MGCVFDDEFFDWGVFVFCEFFVGVEVGDIFVYVDVEGKYVEVEFVVEVYVGVCGDLLCGV